MTIGPIHHVAIVVRSIEDSLPRYRSLLGLSPAEGPIIFGVQGVRLVFLPTGPAPSALIELIEPIDDETGVARYLASHGEGLHHVCLLTDDLPTSLARLAAREARVIDAAPRPGAHGPVAFVHPTTLNGVLWELLEITDR